MLNLRKKGGVSVKFKNKLREYRKKQKITQSELAEKSGVSRSTIIAIENEKAEVVKTDTLIKLAKALDAEMKAIFLRNVFNLLNLIREKRKGEKMEFEFESKEIKELIKDVEDARKKYYRALSKLGVKISDDKNDLILVRKSEIEK